MTAHVVQFAQPQILLAQPRILLADLKEPLPVMSAPGLSMSQRFCQAAGDHNVQLNNTVD